MLMMQNIQYLLLVDVGNTRIKWVLCNNTPLPINDANDLTVFDRHIFLNNTVIAEGACLHADLGKLNLPAEALQNNTAVRIVNVAGAKLEVSLKAFFEAKLDSNSIDWFNTSATSGNVINGYDNIHQLGADRWAALIAAWYLVQADCVVVNAGTAMTIDVLNALPENSYPKLNGFLQAHFKGGLILPGLALMQQSLLSNTAEISEKIQLQNPLPLPENAAIATNTARGMQLGALHAICGAIYNVVNGFSMQTSPPTIIVSGGNADEITTALHNKLPDQTPLNIITVPHLVPYGLYLNGMQ